MPPDERIQSRRPAVTTAERERTIAVLSDRFANGDLDLDEFEERVTAAHRAAQPDELAALTADLAPVPAAEPAQPSVALASTVVEQGSALAIFGGTRRAGAWVVPQHMYVAAMFGGVEIDLREARLPAGAVTLDIHAIFGGVQIIVPPTLAVEMHGSAILGGFENMDRTPLAPDPSMPVVHVRGLAIFGGVNVETRLPGESTAMAHVRRHRQRREERHARRRERKRQS